VRFDASLVIHSSNGSADLYDEIHSKGASSEPADEAVASTSLTIAKCLLLLQDMPSELSEGIKKDLEEDRNLILDLQRGRVESFGIRDGSPHCSLDSDPARKFENLAASKERSYHHIEISLKYISSATISSHGHHPCLLCYSTSFGKENYHPQ